MVRVRDEVRICTYMHPSSLRNNTNWNPPPPRQALPTRATCLAFWKDSLCHAHSLPCGETLRLRVRKRLEVKLRPGGGIYHPGVSSPPNGAGPAEPTACTIYVDRRRRLAANRSGPWALGFGPFASGLLPWAPRGLGGGRGGSATWYMEHLLGLPGASYVG